MDEERASAYIKGVKRVSRIWMTPQAINGYDELGWPQTQNFEAPKHFNFHKRAKEQQRKKRRILSSDQLFGKLPMWARITGMEALIDGGPMQISAKMTTLMYY